MNFSFFTYLTIVFWKKNQSLFYFVPTALEINYTSLSTNILSRWDYENLPRTCPPFYTLAGGEAEYL